MHSLEPVLVTDEPEFAIRPPFEGPALPVLALPPGPRSLPLPPEASPEKESPAVPMSASLLALSRNRRQTKFHVSYQSQLTGGVVGHCAIAILGFVEDGSARRAGRRAGLRITTRCLGVQSALLSITADSGTRARSSSSARDVYQRCQNQSQTLGEPGSSLELFELSTLPAEL